MKRTLRYETVRGQAIEPVNAQSPTFQTRRTEGDSSYRLCQILPPNTFRLEWINEANIKPVQS